MAYKLKRKATKSNEKLKAVSFFSNGHAYKSSDCSRKNNAHRKCHVNSVVSGFVRIFNSNHTKQKQTNKTHNKNWKEKNKLNRSTR